MSITAISIGQEETDKRWQFIERKISSHGQKASGLIEILHSIQDAYGYLDKVPLKKLAASLRVPLSHIYGVASFYHYFSLKPRGEHQCVICLGTACYIKGSKPILSELEDYLGVKEGNTTPDGKVTLLSARCLGSCGLAPAGVFDNEVVARNTIEISKNKIDRWIK